MFEGTYLKIERAKKHVNELNLAINVYLERNPFELIIKKEASKHTWLIKTKEPVPLEFSAILGDAVHNLRTALDLLMFEMVGSKAPNPGSIYFPFCKGAVAIDSAITSGQIQFAGKNVVDALKAIAPYPGGDDLLYGLHILDVTDKHRLILTIARGSDLSAPDLKLIDPNFPLQTNGTTRFTCDTTYIVEMHFLTRAMTRAAQKDRSVVNHKPNVQPTFQICFGKGQPFASELVTQKLGAMVVRVTEACDLLIKAFK